MSITTTAMMLLNALLPSDGITAESLSEPDLHGGFEMGTWDLTYWPMIVNATGMTPERRQAVSGSSPFTATECAAVVTYLKTGIAGVADGKAHVSLVWTDTDGKPRHVPLIPKWHQRLLDLFKGGKVTLVHEGHLTREVVTILPMGAVYTCPVRGAECVDVVLGGYDSSAPGYSHPDMVCIREIGVEKTYSRPSAHIDLVSRMCYTHFPRLKLAPVEQAERAIKHLATIREDIIRHQGEELARIDRTMHILKAYVVGTSP